ncbi:MAG TPA: glycosyltransferase [Anaerolineales bacterium]|nr:glycosyltransferase [Anaerolineales bacterium]
MIDPLTSFYLGIVLFLAVVLLITASNLRTISPLRDGSRIGRWPFVSILVPARNEALRVEACVRSLLALDYPAFEVLALDDESEDETLAVLQRLAAEAPRLRVLAGEPLPAGWRGKAWACHQLAEAAGGEILLFTDADTLHRPTSLRRVVATLLVEDADLLSALPRQRMLTWGERLLVPVLPWSVLSFFPFALATRVRLPFLATAVGQVLLFPAASYARLGGHAGVRGEITEDIALARRAQATGERWRLCDATSEIDCRMYTGLHEALDGFAKNLFAVFGSRVFPYLFVWTWLPIVFVTPWLVALVEGVNGLPHPIRFAAAVVAILASFLLWAVAARKAGLPLSVPLMHPWIVAIASLAAYRSLIFHLRRRATWKGRPLLDPAT